MLGDMKKTIILFLLSLCTGAFFAQETDLKVQEPYDQVYFLNGDVLEAEIKKIDTDHIEYIFPKETFLNIVKKEEIENIVYKSGRVQHFNKRKEAPIILRRPIEKNKIAILPIPFIRQDDGFIESDQKARLAQAKVFNFLTEELGRIYPRTLQTPRETNSILKKTGVKLEDLDQLPIQEIQSYLGVEYIITGRIDYVTNVRQTKISSSSGKIQRRNDDDYRVNDQTVDTIDEDIGYDYTVYIDVYENEVNIYSKNRVPFFGFKNSWEDSFEYIMKRMPIFNRK